MYWLPIAVEVVVHETEETIFNKILEKPSVKCLQRNQSSNVLLLFGSTHFLLGLKPVVCRLCQGVWLREEGVHSTQSGQEVREVTEFVG